MASIVATPRGILVETNGNSRTQNAFRKKLFKAQSVSFFMLFSLLAQSIYALEGAPSTFTVPATQDVAFKYYAKGTQNYKCNLTANAFALDSANADLWETAAMTGNTIGTHFFLEKPDANGGRPTWKHNDGSSVTVKVIVRADSPNPKEDIQWLQTSTTSTAGKGVLLDVVGVLRMKTAKGISPANTECKEDGKIVKIGYESEYWFLKEKSVPVVTTSSIATSTPNDSAVESKKPVETEAPKVEKEYREHREKEHKDEYTQGDAAITSAVAPASTYDAKQPASFDANVLSSAQQVGTLLAMMAALLL